MKPPREILETFDTTGNYNQALKEIDAYYKSKVPKKWTDYETWGEEIHDAVSKAKFEEHNKVITDFHKEK